ncbi:MAG: NADPH:quinone reductase-like Zn-dependent oxidoreductase [Bacteroidia bacterium]|jgi:NADPH:quinone reductase-like Zn-dependent oxidoreductase
MKAIVYNKKHLPYQLEYCDVAKPTASDNEVFIKIVSASINAADYRSMKMGSIPKTKIFGAAVTGIVEAVGGNIQQFKIGDEVIGDLSDFGFGGFAEYAVAPEKALVIKPSNLSFDEAAALPVAATTALKALRDKGSIQRNQQVLIVGGAGGVGTFAVQLAKYYGAKVTAVCSSGTVEQTKSIGADAIIDYTKEDFTKSKKRYDLVVAINGNYSLFAYKRILTPNGMYVMVGGALSQIFKSILFGWILSLGAKKLRFLSAKSDPKDLDFVSKLLAYGKIKSVIESRHSLEQVPKAMHYVSQGHATGKAVINVAKP